MEKPDWPQRRLDPARLWYWSTRLQGRAPLLATALKAFNFFFFRAVLPPHAEIAPDLQLGHHGMNVVVHSNTRIGRDVHLWQGVQLISDGYTGPADWIVIEDGVVIGANAILINRRGRTLTIGRGAVIGAGAVVTKDVPPGVTVVGNPAREVVRALSPAPR